MSIRFYNTMTRAVEEFKPLREGEARLYTCGPTVYNYAHIGNFRAYIFEDLLRRVLRCHGYRVIQAMNLTDVDDKTIRDSLAAGVPLEEHTRKFKDAFFQDLDTLRIERAEHYPAATEHIADMIALIEALARKGYAYQSEDRSVYFSIAKFPSYGRLSRVDLSSLRSCARVSADEYEKDCVSDFALWKAWDARDGDVAWDSPWGRGRPGWHIECSAMAMRHLGESFDIHTGGVDNIFPHHEDEIAQSEAATGKPFANYWLHCEHLLVNGQKMSKSAGNFHTLRDVLGMGWKPSEVRWVLLSAHYRSKLNFTFESCGQARENLKRLESLVRRLRECEASGRAGLSMDVDEPAFFRALADDLNIAGALSVLFDIQRRANKLLESGEMGSAGAASVLAALRSFDRVLGLLPLEGDGGVPPEVQAILDARTQARKARDYAASDAYRARLLSMGWAVEDTPQGPRAVRKA